MSQYDKNGKLRDSFARNNSNMLKKFNMNKIAQYNTSRNRNSVVLSARQQVESENLDTFDNQPGSMSYRGLKRPSQD